MTDPVEKVVTWRPGERALSAMAEAVRRAREMTQATGGKPPELTADVPAGRASRGGRVDPRGGVRSYRQDGPVSESGTSQPAARPSPLVGDGSHLGEKVLQASVVVVGALVLGLGSAVVTLRLSGHTATPVAPTEAGQAPHGSSSTNGVRDRPAPSSAPDGRDRHAGPPRAPAGSAALPASAAGTPELISLSPTGGNAGQVVTVSGVNLFSADGVVQALVGGQAVPTSCPTQTACTVTVPPGMGPPSSLPLTIETEAGTSNALSFSYG